MKIEIKKLYSRAALFSAALIWGSSFFVVKNSLSDVGPSYIIAARNGIAFILLSLVFIKKMKKINMKYLKYGAAIGVFLFIGSVFQTNGLIDTTPGKSAFLTSTYCVIVPFLLWIIYKAKPDKYNLCAALLCVFGVGLIALDNSFSVQTGDALTLISAVFFAAHLIAISRSMKEGLDAILISVLQFGFVCVFSLIYGILFETPPTSLGGDMIFSLLYLSIVATALGIIFQVVGLKDTPASQGAIICSLESVFGVLFSILFYGEVLTLRLVLGFVIVFVAVIVSETKLEFISGIKKRIINKRKKEKRLYNIND